MSKTFNISLLPGDGTGPEVVNEAVKVLSKTSSYYDTQLNFSQNDLGGDRYLKTGNLVTKFKDRHNIQFTSIVSGNRLIVIKTKPVFVTIFKIK